MSLQRKVHCTACVRLLSPPSFDVHVQAASVQCGFPAADVFGVSRSETQGQDETSIVPVPMVRRLGHEVDEREGARCVQLTPGSEIGRTQSPFLFVMLDVDASGGRGAVEADTLMSQEQEG
eukprot:3012759-Rhodomonas_salina.2